MKIPKHAFLVFALIYFFDFILLFINEKNTHEFFIWEINIWFYRIYKLLMVLVFLKLFFERHNKKSGNIEL